MKTRTNEFKNQIKELGREIDFKIGIYINDKLITEDNKFILTQENANLLVEQYDEEEIDEVLNSDSIYNVTLVNKGNILSTMMKEVDFEITEDLRVGNLINCSFGLKVGQDFEYIDYGNYIVFSKEKREDTNTYSYVAFDSMLLSMVEVDDTSIIQGVTVKKAIENICDKVGLTVNITNEDITKLPNLNKTINQSAFNNVQMTYRDVLDMICQCLGISMIVDGKELKLKYFNDTIVDEFDESYFYNTNVTFNKLYGPVNSVVLSRSEDNDNIYKKDDESIAENGLNEFKIKDNLIMLYDDREDYLDEIFDQLQGLEYYINDVASIGITYLEWLDQYNVNIKDKTYKCLMLNDEIKIRSGLKENIYAEEPLETVTDYTTSGKTDKEVSFIVDKQNGNINAKVTKGQVINEINLDESGASINAEKISLEGKEINLTSDDITIESDNFSVDSDGMITATGGDIGGFKLESTKFEKDLSGKYDYTYDDVALVAALYLGMLDQGTSIDSIMDYTNEGSITPFDAVNMINIINGRQENTRIFNGKFEINSSDLKNCIKLSKDGQTIVSMGLGGINTAYLSAKNFSCGHTSGSNSTNFIGTTIKSSDGAIIINDGNGNKTTIEAGKITLEDGNDHTKVITATS